LKLCRILLWPIYLFGVAGSFFEIHCLCIWLNWIISRFPAKNVKSNRYMFWIDCPMNRMLKPKDLNANQSKIQLENLSYWHIISIDQYLGYGRLHKPKPILIHEISIFCMLCDDRTFSLSAKLNYGLSSTTPLLHCSKLAYDHRLPPAGKMLPIFALTVAQHQSIKTMLNIMLRLNSKLN
jgi:hypothetical protein